MSKTYREIIEDMLTEGYDRLSELEKSKTCASVGTALFHQTFDNISDETLLRILPVIHDAQDIIDLRWKAYKKRLKKTDPRDQEWEELSKEYEKAFAFAQALAFACDRARGDYSQK